MMATTSRTSGAHPDGLELCQQPRCRHASEDAGRAQQQDDDEHDERGGPRDPRESTAAPDAVQPDDEAAGDGPVDGADAAEDDRGEDEKQQQPPVVEPEGPFPEDEHVARDAGQSAADNPRRADDALGRDAGDEREVLVVGHRAHRLAEFRPL